MSSITNLVAGLVGLLAGSVAHEATHYLLARVAGARARIVWVRAGLRSHPEVQFASTGRVADTLVRLGPLLVGGLAAVGWVLVRGLVLPSWPVGAAWVSFTLLGGLADYSAAASRGARPNSLTLHGVDDRPAWASRALRFSAVAFAAYLGLWMLFSLPVLPGALWYSATSLAAGLAIAMSLLAAMELPDEVMPR